MKRPTVLSSPPQLVSLKKVKTKFYLGGTNRRDKATVRFKHPVIYPLYLFENMSVHNSENFQQLFMKKVSQVEKEF
jgi:hypothetical protein